MQWSFDYVFLFVIFLLLKSVFGGVNQNADFPFDLGVFAGALQAQVAVSCHLTPMLKNKQKKKKTFYFLFLNLTLLFIRQIFYPNFHYQKQKKFPKRFCFYFCIFLLY